MEVLKFKKMAGGKYKVICTKDEFVLYEDVIIKYNLLSSKNLDLKTINKLLEENKYYEVYNLAIKYIEVKMRSKEELRKYLSKKEYDDDLVDKVINKLTDLNLINDNNYISAYINDKINLSNYGPLKIKSELLKNKIDESEVDKYLSNFDNDLWQGRIDKIINKKLSLNKTKSTMAFKKSMYNELLNLGYPSDMIGQSLNDIKASETDALRKEYDKLYNKFKGKQSSNELKFKIRKSLLSKGFSIDSINNIMEEYE